MYKVYLFRGDEKYLTNIKIKKIVKDSKVDELNLSTYDCSEVKLEDAILDASTYPFLSDIKVVIIKNPTFLESDKTNHNVDMLVTYLARPNDSAILIINASGMKINENTKAMKALLKKSNDISISNTNTLSEEEFIGWLQRECETQGKVRIDDASCKVFINTMGVDLEAAKTEIDKMITYVGPGGVINEDVIKKLFYKNNLGDINALTNAIFARNKDEALRIYFELKKYEKDSSVFVNRITYSFKDTYLVKLYSNEGLNQNQIATKMHLSPGRVYYLLKDAKNYDLREIETYISKLAKLDYKIKTGKIDKTIGFEEFLLSI